MGSCPRHVQDRCTIARWLKITMHVGGDIKMPRGTPTRTDTCAALALKSSAKTSNRCTKNSSPGSYLDQNHVQTGAK